MKKLRVTFSDNTVWHVDVNFIATHYANHYAKRGEDSKAEWEGNHTHILTDDEDALDWAKNNMNWKDFKNNSAVEYVETIPIEYHGEWPNAESKIIDLPEKG